MTKPIADVSSSSSSSYDSDLEKACQEEQDYWLKMCSNLDPNDNVIRPDAFIHKDFKGKDCNDDIPYEN